MEKHIELEKYKISIYSGCEDPKTAKTIVYFHGHGGDAGKSLFENICLKAPGKDFVLAVISGPDWDADLSPWKAGKAFKGSNDFAGGADEYIKVLTGTIVPQTEAEVGAQFDAENRAIAGYSLAGLFAVYCPYKSNLFGKVMSASGSLWYDRFLKFVSERKFPAQLKKAYFSLGDRESQTGNKRLAAVGPNTEAIVKIFSEHGVQSTFESNAGGHFDQVEDRTAKGIAWIID